MKIRTRITLWITGAGVIVSLLFSIFIFQDMAEQSYHQLDRELKLTIRDIFPIIRDPGHPDTSLGSFFTRRNYWIKAWRGKQLVYTSPLAQQLELPTTPGRRKETVSVTIPKSRIDLDQDRFNEVTFRVWTTVIPAAKAPPGYRIQAALPMEPLEEKLNRVIFGIVLGLVGSALLLFLISWFLAGRILRPVKEITARAREIDEKGLADRLPTSDNRDELYELATALNQMLDRLQYSFRRQQEFIAGAAHELNTPLTSLRLFSEQAQTEPGLSPELRQQLARQHDTLLRMGRLLRSLMLLAALEVRPQAEIRTFDFSRLVRVVLEDLAPLIEYHGLKVATDLPPRQPCEGDEEKLRRVLINLVENAVKYNVEEGEIRIVLETGKNRRLTLEIANRCPRPLPEEELEQVFEQFYRVEKSRSREFGGCGLGLTIVREIVSLHRGTIRLENRPGGWLAAILELPRQAGGRRPERTEEKEKKSPSEPASAPTERSEKQ